MTTHRDSQEEPGDSMPHEAHFRSNGEPVAAILRGHDWAASSIGHPPQWPQALRGAVSMVLDAPVPMWLAWGTDLGMVYNEAFARILGGRHPDAMGAAASGVLGDVFPGVWPLLTPALTGPGRCLEDLPLHGVRRWFSLSCAPLRDEAGAVRGLICTAWETTDKVQAQRRGELARGERDRLARLPTDDALPPDARGAGLPTSGEMQVLTERNAAQAALFESERQFKALFNSMDEGFCVIEFLDGPHGPMSDYVHVLANPAYLANAGIADVVGQRVREMVPNEAAAWVETYREVLVTGQPIRFERELVKTGRYLALAAFRIDPAERRQVAVLFQDVTKRHRAEAALRELNETLERRVAEEVSERTKTEAALRQSQKMEAVGQLTGGIAHDFNNMLAVVIGSLDLLGRRFATSDARALRYVEAARDGAKRAAQLTQRLLAFSRQQPLKPESVDVNKLVAGMSDLLRHSLGGAVLLETVLAGGMWRTHADPNQLENAILNLAVNGRDAMADGGRLTIETANSHLDERYAAEHVGLSCGQYVMVAISDTGSGMAPEVVAKAFDPFFTTKEVGRGTGLGLSQVYGFVKQSGGHVKIYSEVGQGTVIKIYLPRFTGTPTEEANAAAAPGFPLGDGDELVLLVEDEPAVRQFSAEALAELGYRVLEADGAAAALRLLDAHPEISLLLTDVVMPEVNGRRLADEALKRRPELKVLFMTGYTRNAVVHNGVLDAGVQLIGKPFTIDELAVRVREVLDTTN